MRQSAGILLYRSRAGYLEVLLVHPGGPFWARRDDGESPLDAARREFREETGGDVAGPFHALQPVRLAGGKRVHAFAARGDFDVANLVSNSFTIEWPPRSGRMRAFPEVDRAQWFGLDEAASKLHPAQSAWLGEIKAIALTT